MSIQHENRIAALEKRVAALEMALLVERKPEPEFEPPPVPPNTLIERARRVIKGST